MQNQKQSLGKQSKHNESKQAGKNEWSPVSPKEFRKQAKDAHGFFNILRIFMKDKDVTDRQIEDLLLRKKLADLDQETIVKKEYVMEDDYDPYTEDPQDRWTKAADHLEEVHSSPLASCRLPKPELVYVPSEGNKIFTPEYTILHRCRNTTGCCWNRSQTCVAKRIQVVEKYFIVLTTAAGGQIPHDDMVETKLFLNHTECECQDLTPLPGCDQRCPHPFKKQRRSEHCTCECEDDSLSCLQIKFGLSALDADEFQCIKDGQCMTPECDSGDFDMRKGYCPGTQNRPNVLLMRDKRNTKR
ncbi:hypothetical protein FSP39_010411 [Pinctada imbricata]|uniref:Platelet-derived growth factor (PDGF) family profile domain-containing protein n=1 Tax=Pinctada imbricata TaxID=66713 RepID=A0AA89BX78_PINIB|nr:hypothetical protein FSP39_010411 [Pinctada imbricata]